LNFEIRTFNDPNELDFRNDVAELLRVAQKVYVINQYWSKFEFCIWKHVTVIFVLFLLVLAITYTLLALTSVLYPILPSYAAMVWAA